MSRLVWIMFVSGLVSLYGAGAQANDHDKTPPWSYLDGITYSVANIDVYACPSKKCKKIKMLPPACQLGYFEPAGDGDYGKWIRIKDYRCRDKPFEDFFIDGYVLESNTHYAEEKTIYGYNGKVKDFQLRLCLDKTCPVVFDSRSMQAKDHFKNVKCIIVIDYLEYAEKNLDGWQRIKMNDCLLKKQKGHFAFAKIVK